jgi:hypothetical protein
VIGVNAILDLQNKLYRDWYKHEGTVIIGANTCPLLLKLYKQAAQVTL